MDAYTKGSSRTEKDMARASLLDQMGTIKSVHTKMVFRTARDLENMRMVRLIVAILKKDTLLKAKLHIQVEQFTSELFKTVNGKVKLFTFSHVEVYTRATTSKDKCTAWES